MSDDQTDVPASGGDDSGTGERPATNRMPKIDCRVPEELRDALDRACEERGFDTRSAGIREALREWVG